MLDMPDRWKPNVTVSAIIERDGRFLLVEEETADGLKLNVPAGHLDPAESPIDACAREVSVSGPARVAPASPPRLSLDALVNGARAAREHACAGLDS